MPQVPYTGAPTVSPTERGVGGMSTNASAESFGAASARGLARQGEAEAGLGRTLEKAGDEIFGRAIAMQDLANHTEADEAHNKYILESIKLRSDFMNLQGQDAKNGLEAHNKTLQDLRERIGSTLTNPMSKKLYDTASGNTFTHAVVSAGQHAGAMMKQWTLNTSKAKVDLLIKQANQDPTDERLFQSTRAEIIDAAKFESAQLGMGEGSPQEELLIATKISTLSRDRILELSRKDPAAAAALLEKTKDLLSSDRGYVENTVRGQMRSAGSVDLANRIYEDNRDGGKTFEEMEKQVRAAAEKEKRGDPLFVQAAVSAFQNRWHIGQRAEKEELAADHQAVYSAINSGVADTKALRADPKLAPVIDRLTKTDPKFVLGIDKMLEARNKKADFDTSKANYDRLQGMALRDREVFLNQDLYAVPMQEDHRNRILKLREGMIKRDLDDPHTFRALRQIQAVYGASMKELGIYRRKDNEADFDKFVGGLRSALHAWTDTHKKAPTEDEVVRIIGPSLLREVTEPAWFGWSTRKVPVFKAEIPEEARKVLEADAVNRGLPSPSEDAMRRDYNNALFNRLFAPKKAAK